MTAKASALQGAARRWLAPMSVLRGSEGAMQESEQGEVLSISAAQHPPSLLPLCSVTPWAARCDLVIEQDWRIILLM